MNMTGTTHPWVCGDCQERFTEHAAFIAHKYLMHWQQEHLARIREIRRLKNSNAALQAENATLRQQLEELRARERFVQKVRAGG